jgi:hypothetical protein
LVTEPAAAVTVMVVPAATPAPDRVALIVPSEAVVAVAPESVPALADSVTAIPLSALLFASFASTVMVAVLLPSVGIDVALLETSRLETPAVVPPLVLVVQLVVVVVVVVVPPVSLLQPLSPPQPARESVIANKTIIEASVRIVLLPES